MTMMADTRLRLRATFLLLPACWRTYRKTQTHDQCSLDCMKTHWSCTLRMTSRRQYIERCRDIVMRSMLRTDP